MTEVYILNSEQKEWFYNRTTKPVKQLFMNNTGDYHCIEKEYTEQEGYEDVKEYILEQNIAITLI